MKPSRHLIHYSILLFVLTLTACQMPVKPNRDMPDKPSSTPPAVSPVVEPENTTQPIPDEVINMVEAHVVDTPAVSDDMNKRLGSTVFARLKNNFSGPICNDNPAIHQWKKRYAGNPRAFSNHLGEILPLLDYVSSEVERRKLPAEFALIPIIESWYQPHAVGAGGPSGMWQMIGTTAKNHGIKIQADYDGRFSVVDSTDAALSYLGTLQGMFKDWQRAVMGYNAGEFRVLRAIRSSGNKSEGQDHWPHGLSPITYAYIAKLQALSCLISEPEKNNLSLPEAREFTPLAAILVEADTGSLDSLAKRHQLDAEILKRNNPAYKRGQISIHAPRRILMPAYLAVGSVANMANTELQNSQTTSSGSAEKPTLEANTGSHEIKSGDTLWSIAKRYGISITSLRKLNGLGRNPVLRVGQILKLAP